MSVIWFLLSLYAASVTDLAIHQHKKWGMGKPRLTPIRKLADWLTGHDDKAFLIAGFIVAALPAVRLLALPFSWDWGIFLGFAGYGAYVVTDEPKGQAFLKKRFGNAWTKIRKRLGLPERLRLSEEENVLRGLEASLLAQIGDHPLLVPIAANVRLLVRVEAPRLLEQRSSINLGLSRVRDNLHATREEPNSDERTRNLGIETRLCAKLEAKQALLDQMRHKLVHLVPVIEDVRIDLEAGDGSDVQDALRYLDDLTAAIRASVTEDVPVLPAADDATKSAPRTRVS